MAAANTTTEIWKPVPGYEGLYEASDLGRIRSLDRFRSGPGGTPRLYRGRILRPCKSRLDYVTVHLWKDQLRKVVGIHRLVLSAHVRLPLPGEEANHLNFDPSDNRLANLEWVSAKQNCHHIGAAGRRYGPQKLTAPMVSEIRRRLAGGESTASLAAAFGVVRQTIRDIALRTTWSREP